ncbi:flavodoxin family protein [Cryobacterium zhongshanensis]|uniref:Flavodoxin domain-containing protein n=1 Tax=Cryobacterium zhongshanensis TaxID=2928153 RepID=A0AA41QUE7_9MICO|nr:flavodoxin domain-containing protein [Cryobacterium zhongshanensis]MCI4657177.1 flavodoxin domain-containing protein [Cryobacterium zhongshanensis]
MSALVVFDSNYGNTESVAAAIADALGGSAVLVSTVSPDSLTGVDLLVLGCPINGWRPSPRMLAFLDQLGAGSLRGIQAAAFDTRLRSPIHGDAAGKVTRKLKSAGAHVLARPTGFIVEGKTGPLADGELDRAREWADSIVTALAS